MILFKIDTIENTINNIYGKKMLLKLFSVNKDDFKLFN